jgi:hypothetical protein
MAIPFFILAGNFLTHGGVAKRMIRFATSMVGHWHGGLGLGVVLACALFAAVSGSSPATVVAIGSILMPAMVKAGFPNRFGAGVITTSGALGILIPPSIVMVIYCVATGGSIVSETATYELLLRSFLTVWVRTTPEEHMRRVLAQGDLRPMAGSPRGLPGSQRTGDKRAETDGTDRFPRRPSPPERLGMH